MTPKERIADLLIDWYRKNGREYPWRGKCTPFQILMAEIMLQRTKADQVTPVYLAFLKKFPDPERLGEASRKEIAIYFSKLGLIRRARLVVLFAQDLLTRFNGKIPRDRKELLSLPSVGEYTADALLCFAFDEDVTVVDSNVCRIVSRVFGLKARGEARRDPRYRKILDEILPSGKAKEFNWALIDLGALVCKPNNPLCKLCPLGSLCKFAMSQLGRISGL